MYQRKYKDMIGQEKFSFKSIKATHRFFYNLKQDPQAIKKVGKQKEIMELAQDFLNDYNEILSIIEHIKNSIQEKEDQLKQLENQQQKVLDFLGVDNPKDIEFVFKKDKDLSSRSLSLPSHTNHH
jgi:mevalonate kinase